MNTASLDLFPVPAGAIVHVYRMPTGTVYCFDAESRLLPEFSGQWSDLEQTIRRNMRHDATVHE